MPPALMADLGSSCELLIVPDWVWGLLTIMQEARSEPFEGQVGVGESIRNRMRNRYFSNGTFRDTVLRPYQYSGWNTSDPNRIICAGFSWNSPVTIQALEAFNEAFSKNSNLTQGAMFYHANTMEKYPNWTRDPRVKKTIEISKHIFYKLEGFE